MAGFNFFNANFTKEFNSNSQDVNDWTRENLRAIYEALPLINQGARFYYSSSNYYDLRVQSPGLGPGVEYAVMTQYNFWMPEGVEKVRIEIYAGSGIGGPCYIRFQLQNNSTNEVFSTANISIGGPGSLYTYYNSNLAIANSGAPFTMQAFMGGGAPGTVGRLYDVIIRPLWE